MIDYKNQTVKQSFGSMADVQDAIEQLYIMTKSAPQLDADAVCLSCEAIAEAVGVSLDDAAFQGSEQPD